MKNLLIIILFVMFLASCRDLFINDLHPSEKEIKKEIDFKKRIAKKYIKGLDTIDLEPFCGIYIYRVNEREGWHSKHYRLTLYPQYCGEYQIYYNYDAKHVESISEQFRRGECHWTPLSDEHIDWICSKFYDLDIEAIGVDLEGNAFFYPTKYNVGFSLIPDEPILAKLKPTSSLKTLSNYVQFQGDWYIALTSVNY